MSLWDIVANLGTEVISGTIVDMIHDNSHTHEALANAGSGHDLASLVSGLHHGVIDPSQLTDGQVDRLIDKMIGRQ